MLDRARANPKIKFLTPYMIEELHDVQKKNLESIRIRNLATRKFRRCNTDGVFLGIGHDPNTAIFKGQLDMNPDGYLIVHDGSQTNVEGVFAAGDVHDHIYRQAITAAGVGLHGRD